MAGVEEATFFSEDKLENASPAREARGKPNPHKSSMCPIHNLTVPTQQPNPSLFVCFTFIVCVDFMDE
jgi:hypothetical protein